jgi:hypothetical protein
MGGTISPSRCAADSIAGACFRTLTNDDGMIELPAWEVPKRTPHERRRRAPDWEPGAAAAEIAELSAERDNPAGGDIAA